MRTETITVLPALFLFILSSYLMFFSQHFVDLSAKDSLLTASFFLFFGGLTLAVCWIYYWVVSKRLRDTKSSVISRQRSLPNLIGLSLIAFGSITLVWVGQLIWHDITMWNKDLLLILFGSRTGEHISLGIGMKVIHYFLIGLTLLFPGLVIFLRRRLRKCPHHFGYLASYPKKDSLPKKCLICPKVAGCIAIPSPRTSGEPQKPKELVKSTAEKEKDSSKCSHDFGYLRSLPNDEAVPHECVTCQELLECRNLI